MATYNIKQLKDSKNGNPLFPKTHTKAVVDDNGYTVESRMQAVQDVVNQAQMAIGAVPNDLAPTEGSTNWVTSGGVYNAMQVVQSELAELAEEDVKIELKYLGSYTIDTTSGELVSTSNYSCYEGSLDGLTSLMTTNKKASTTRGLFAFYDSSDNLVGNVYTNAGTNLEREIANGATKFKISSYNSIAEASSKRMLSAYEINNRLNKNIYNRSIELNFLGSYTIDLSTGELVSSNTYLCYEGSVVNCKNVYTTNNSGSSKPGIFAFYDSSDNLVDIVSTSAGTGVKREVVDGAVKFKLATYTTTATATGDFTLNDASLLGLIFKIGTEYISNSLGKTLVQTSYSSNLINVNNLLYGYTLSSGAFTPSNKGVFSNKIYVDKGEYLVCKGIKPFSTYNKCYIAYFNSNDAFLFRAEENFQDTTEQICSFMTSSENEWDYLRILISGSGSLGNGGLTSPMCCIGQLPDEYEEYIPILNFKALSSNEKKTHVPHILITGASFVNIWAEIMLGMVGATATNKAASGSSIMGLAKSMWNGGLYDSSTLDSYDILMIMHVHNYNVADTSVMKENYTDYTYEEISENYTQAYDYVIRKWQADCYNQKDNQDSKWYGSKYGKPAMIVLCTSWHNGRTIYNDSIRILAEKFALPLIDWASQIGVSSSVNNPVTGSNATVYYAQDMEGSRGWHPLRDANPNGTIQWLQVRMATIAANVLKPVCDSFLYID